MPLTPVVLDLSHHQDLEPDAFRVMKANGIEGVILKATEGTGYVDKTYAKRRKEAEAAGLLVGAYHFARGSSPEAQAAHFLRVAKPDDSLLLALDWEDLGLTCAKAVRFLNAVMAKTGRRPDQVWVYTGHVGKELIKSKAERDYFSQFPLWLCHYTAVNRVKVPDAWDHYGLWQYSDKGHFPGIKRGGSVDLNVFGGKNLKAEWAAGPKLVAVPAAPEVIREPTKKPVEPKDLVPVSRKARRANWIKRGAHTIWISLGFDQIMEWFGIAQQTRRQVEMFVTDNAVVLAITLAILAVVAVKGIERLMAEDVNEGRAVPSGGLPAK